MFFISATRLPVTWTAFFNAWAAGRPQEQLKQRKRETDDADDYENEPHRGQSHAAYSFGDRVSQDRSCGDEYK